MNDTEAYDRARRRVRQIKGFYAHATVYVLVNAFLAALNLATSRSEMWFVWPLLGWGIGLAVHAASVFGFEGFWGQEWEERKIREIIEKNRPQ